MKTILTDNTPITQDKKISYLLSDASSGTNYLVLQSTAGFEQGSLIICIGDIPSESSEIAKILVAKGGSLRLTANTQFDHHQDTKVTIIDWDRWEVSWSATVSGTKSTLSGYLNLQVDQLKSLYNDKAQSSGFYFTRFNESWDNTYTDYGDAIPYIGYDDNMVASIKKRALESVGEEISDLITNEFLDSALWEARREYHKAPGKRPFRKKFNAAIGYIRTGQYRIKAPIDLEKPYTGENIFAVKIGNELPMDYYEKKDLDQDYIGVAHSTLSVALGTSDSFVVLSNNRDFEDKGNIRIDGDEIVYTARDVSNGSLVLGNLAATAHSVGADIWQNSSEGNPRNFTAIMDPDGSNYICFSRPIETALARQNVYSDYFTAMPTLDSDADVIDEPYPMPDAYVNYLSWKIKKKKNKGLIDQNDNDYIEWIKKKSEALGTEYAGQHISFVPDINHLQE